jgi:hypothetical protein
VDRGTSLSRTRQHRLLPFITINWRGKPLRSCRIIAQRIAGTQSQTGLELRAEWEENKYPKGVKVSDALLAAVNLSLHAFHGGWNDTSLQPARNVIEVFYGRALSFAPAMSQAVIGPGPAIRASIFHRWLWSGCRAGSALLRR